MTGRPFVSAIIPARNEVHHLAGCIESILAGTYPPDRLELIVVDGMSEDGTRRVAERFAARHPTVRVIDNPRRIQAAALNAGIRLSRGEVIFWANAHTVYGREFIARAVEHLEAYGADAVGGRVVAHPRRNTLLGKAIARALSHPFGVGASYSKTSTGEPRWFDAVFGGCYRREVFDRVGGFNEHLARGADMEFHRRLALAGGRLLLVPSIECTYYAHSDLRSFLRRNWDNGVWATLPFAYSPVMPVAWRHLVPLAFVGALTAAAVLGLVWAPARWAILALGGSYLATSLGVSAVTALAAQDLRYAAVMPVVFAAIHLPYGVGSLWGLLRAVRAGRGRRGPADPVGVAQEMLKRLFDTVVAAVMVAVLLPLFAVIAMLITLDSPGPVFHRGTRVGRGGQPFRIFKFRTMVPDAEQRGGPSTPRDDPRITRVGRWLRRYNLDELPQFLNVLRGEMSIVGPRPEVPQYVARFTPEERQILAVRPGITDWATIWVRDEGRILERSPDPERTYFERIWPEKHRLALEYVRDHSLWVDLKIIAMTLRVHLLDRLRPGAPEDSRTDE